MMRFEREFLKRIYQLSFLSSLWAASFLLIGKFFSEGFSFLSGAIIGILLLMAMEFMVRRITTKENTGKNKVLAFIFLKYPFIGALFYALVRWERFNIAFFALGLTLPYLVIFLKGAGGMNKHAKETATHA